MKRRFFLTSAVVSAPDVLLVEPTNHLIPSCGSKK